MADQKRIFIIHMIAYFDNLKGYPIFFLIRSVVLLVEHYVHNVRSINCPMIKKFKTLDSQRLTPSIAEKKLNNIRVK